MVVDRERANKGGARPRVNETNLAERFGLEAVELTRLLYEMRDEANLSSKEVAQRWANTAPEECRKVNVLTTSNEINPKRLSEVMQWQKGILPAGLIRAYLYLWQETFGANAEQVRLRAEQLTNLSAAIKRKAAAQPTGTRGRPANTVQLYERITALQAELLETEKARGKALQERAELQKIVLVQLQVTADLRRQLNLAAIDPPALPLPSNGDGSDGATETALVVSVEMPQATADSVMRRIQEQVDFARRKAFEAEMIAASLRQRSDDLREQLRDMTGELVAANPPVVPVASQSLNPLNEWLDRTGELLRTRTADLDAIREAVQWPVASDRHELPGQRRRTAVVRQTQGARSEEEMDVQDYVRSDNLDNQRPYTGERVANDRFEAVFHASAIGMALTDMADNLVQTNSTLAQILECSENDLRGRSILELFPPEDADDVVISYREVTEGIVSRIRERRRMVRHDGTIAWVYLVISLLRDSHGDPAHHVTMVENLSELQALQNQLGQQSVRDMLTGVRVVAFSV